MIQNNETIEVNEKELVNRQLDYFEKLTELNCKPDFVFDGSGHKNFFGNNKHHYQTSWLHKQGKLVQDRLRFNGQEIIIDPDCDWSEVKKKGDKILNFFEDNSIPYELLLTGRNVRFHIYTTNSIQNYAREIMKDPQQLCFYVYQFLCHSIGINWQDFGVPENQARDHLLGTIGKKNIKTGFYCTWSDIIPEIKPETKLCNIKFSDELRSWNIKKDFLNDAINYSSKIPEKEVKLIFKNKKYSWTLVRF